MNDSTDTRYSALKQIRDELLDFKESPLFEYRKKNGFHPVIGEGNHYANIMFIGEAPGENEAKQARPFCGASGRILDELLASIDLKREDVYVTNVVKDRPPENRDPSPEEIELYTPFLDRQIDIIQPKVLATLGRFSMKYIMDKFELFMESGPISKLHGQIFEAPSSWGTVKIIPLLHPAVALYGASKKGVLLADFKVLKEFV
ncbi:hypothetical protein A3D80_03700 [Candidatus Roizmanbacteria bacterium RIFCSPHIGHO2_02_FULL_40_13b]|uniref:Type-4 uracil-DNA glycosylase n=1 Tax=Candidatus Roizmanbacteria bacterium RIFCSPHIGHO2_01_FULL_39_24 TaxID=1802032 RepID=A0A1F7GJV7_9BACT|nr:MAG: hypothetical protein A2799_04110 [Candidatus Roizmanbacteria bacterium RIFCSPHIGHO2_01_FULL_39_24]OGK27067.1 MAG: hypothetical protein A3D80_03700 [Candidatus Roizmanbacteria bacterium RIFCSPHIGHO2_02_FULL_40_13b]OGK49143.1 MAG: hypothetical protein A3A56_00870 [Candidatus Roizmanbacteria bacterium RIFCSPLOWO2_01_FULL_40_32]OGK56834.1 MAG: hypothetical protein A3H83_01170 [Candidatus Roizmanbacteria bacterium RIFCSPLOWO2_02_FULL_39_8]